MTPPTVHRGLFRRPRKAALLAAPLLAVPLLTATATGTTAAPEDSESTTITLVTGDVVTYQERDGEPTFSVDTAPRDDDVAVTFLSSGDADNFYVYPSDIAAQVYDGRLDDELFNIPGLIRQGLDDASTGGELPVIVIFDGDRDAGRLKRDADALPATARPVAVEAVNGAGVTVDSDEADQFRAAVLDPPDPATPSAQSAGLGGDVSRIYLDQVLTVDLAESVPQIGAPEVWDSGYSGQGITVGVLDTGVDANHPDLAGKVAAERDFTGANDPGDDYGHGTHVASTIAGTGAASDGTYTGVAPAATLVNAKVCDANGECPTSAILTGMEWAAGQADIVNMSLGSDVPSDGTDILSQSLNDLTTDTGTLFVTSAGNDGPRMQAVSAPGVADAALAVGAVDKSDVIAGFSSRGLRVGDFAVKPDITAPGVDIVAARAAGTNPPEPVGEHYTKASGTSMAAPHVAGAAALLAQARPGSTPAELKEVLASTATDGGYRAWEQGTGRVDVPRAVGQGVYGLASVSFGDVSDLDDSVAREIVYTNRTSTDVTLQVDADVTDEAHQPVGDGFSLSAQNVTVPANGRASITASVDPEVVAGSGAFGGVVTAVGGDAQVRTAVGFGRESAHGQQPFTPNSTSWVSPTEGWVLGWTLCEDGLCAQLRHTVDGGQSWSVENAPELQPSEFGDQTRVIFVAGGKRSTGIVTDGRQLFVSSDGARTWRPLDLGVDYVGAIDATEKSIYLAGLTQMETGIDTQVFTTRIGKNTWTAVEDLKASVPSFGGVASTLTDVATNGRLVQVSTSTFDAEDRVWTSPKGKEFTAADPCREWSATRVGAGGAARQFALCTFNAGRGHSDKELMVTTDGGETYSSVSLAPRIGITSDFAVADESTIAIGATGGDMGIVLMSFDGGATWETTLGEPNTGPVLDLDFQDSLHGTLVTGYPTLGTARVYRTDDGGHTWYQVRFAE